MYAKVNKNKDLWMRLEISYEYLVVVHTLPENEQDLHDPEFCSCNPRITQTVDGFLVSHNSFDRREIFEKDSILLN